MIQNIPIRLAVILEGQMLSHDFEIECPEDAQVVDFQNIVKNALAANYPAYKDIEVGGFRCGMADFEPGDVIKDFHPRAADRIYGIASAHL
jgi:hypothetical protein